LSDEANSAYEIKNTSPCKKHKPVLVVELFRTLAGFGGELVDLHARGKGMPCGLSVPIKRDNVMEEVPPSRPLPTEGEGVRRTGEGEPGGERRGRLLVHARPGYVEKEPGGDEHGRGHHGWEALH
jgi:hypothetical protein